MEILQVLVDNQPNEQVAACRSLLLGRKGVKRLGENLVRRAVADLVDDVLLYFREGPGLANGRAALRSNPDQPHLAADGNGHAAFVKNLAVEIHLGCLFAGIAAGQPAKHR